MQKVNEFSPQRGAACRPCREALQHLQALDFALAETVLYLDAYPDCAQALDYYHTLTEQRSAALAHYETTCGPITAYGNTDKNAWNWIASPWPWEPDAN